MAVLKIILSLTGWKCSEQWSNKLVCSCEKTAVYPEHTIGGSRHKYHFCREKHVFVATKVCLPRQNLCRHKFIFFVSTKKTFCRDKSKLVATKITSVSTNIIGGSYHWRELPELVFWLWCFG